MPRHLIKKSYQVVSHLPMLKRHLERWSFAWQSSRLRLRLGWSTLQTLVNKGSRYGAKKLQCFGTCTHLYVPLIVCPRSAFNYQMETFKCRKEYKTGKQQEKQNEEEHETKQNKTQGHPQLMWEQCKKKKNNVEDNNTSNDVGRRIQWDLCPRVCRPTACQEVFPARCQPKDTNKYSAITITGLSWHESHTKKNNKRQA